MERGCQPGPPRRQVLLIVPPGWLDHLPGLVVLRDHLHGAFGASLTIRTAPSSLLRPVPVFSGSWPAPVGAQLAPLIDHAFFVLDAP